MTTFNSSDIEYMQAALRLAEKGRYSTTPNPHVGCVIVNQDQQVVGQGYHQVAGQAHAEINALNEAGIRAQNSTVYVTLEPCSHTNRTGPCAYALVEAKVKRVFVACTDPNPKVSGRGIEILRQANIEVQVGLCKQQALYLNRHFFHRMKYARPYVTVKLAASVDGRTALENGESKWISNELSRADVQVERAASCAILTGADTVLKDDPQLNVRSLTQPVSDYFALRGKQPVRLIIDSKNRLHEQLTMFKDGNPIIVFNLKANPNLSLEHITQVQLPLSVTDKQYVCLDTLFKHLSQFEFNHIWVEAGATLTGELFNQGYIDELVLYQAPKFLGSNARPLSNINSPVSLDQVNTVELADVKQLGHDLRIRYRFNQAYNNRE